MCGSDVIGGFDSHAFPPIRRETPSKSGVFCYIADWLKLSKNGNLCHYIATLNLRMARFAMKYINESSGFMQSVCYRVSYYNMYTLACNEHRHSQSAWSEIWLSVK